LQQQIGTYKSKKIIKDVTVCGEETVEQDRSNAIKTVRLKQNTAGAENGPMHFIALLCYPASIATVINDRRWTVFQCDDLGPVFPQQINPPLI